MGASISCIYIVGEWLKQSCEVPLRKAPRGRLIPHTHPPTVRPSEILSWVVSKTVS